MDAAQARRLLALATIYDGGTRSEAARLSNATLEIDMMRFDLAPLDAVVIT